MQMTKHLMGELCWEQKSDPCPIKCSKDKKEEETKIFHQTTMINQQ
jgi:hypothetical protein